MSMHDLSISHKHLDTFEILDLAMESEVRQAVKALGRRPSQPKKRMLEVVRFSKNSWTEARTFALNRSDV